MQAKNDLSLIYKYRAPRDNDGTKKPIIFLIHGYGANESDLFSFASELSGQFHVIAPRAVYDLPFGGHAWYAINIENGVKTMDIQQARESRDKLKSFVEEAVSAYGADSENVWILGFSQGAILSYSLMAHYPSLAKHYMTLSGYVEPRLMPEAPEKENLDDIKVFAMHGSADQVIPIELGRSAPEFLKNMEVEHIYKEFPIGHGVSPQGFWQMQEWMNEELQR